MSTKEYALTTPKTARRIYLVRDHTTGVERLIRAVSPAQARAHAARDQFDVSVATQEQLVALLTRGPLGTGDAVIVEDAGSDANPNADDSEDAPAPAPAPLWPAREE